ncbi:uncharacterized protein LOC124294783 [Neodiprion lecontei]|uniref:Uncharacterized protein LOC124294783 n=1 Tax=Neodiprion lecontei TaxID=441921 RepID=A0ABM3GC33_NEOLC|nr:uncharacterized protein LOC124294783 [Neodiprion lecontei]
MKIFNFLRLTQINLLIKNSSLQKILFIPTLKLKKAKLLCIGGARLVFFLLLESYRALEKDFYSGKISQKNIWEKVAKELKVKGHDVTGPQCSSKLRSLKKTYKSIKDHNNKSGNDRRTWQFFDIMEEIFSKKAWCDPVAVASSTGLSKKSLETNDSMGGSDSGCSIKSKKTPVATLLGKRLKQKEEHEAQKNKRHEERMEMDEKFLNVLEKLANK